MTVMFWVVAALSVGTIKGVMEGLLLDQARIVKIAEADERLLAVNEAGVVQVWDARRREWRQIYEPNGRGGGMPTIDGPFYHAATKQLLFGQGFRNPFGFIGQRITLRVAQGRRRLDAPRRARPAQRHGEVPARTTTARVLAVAPDNIYRLKGDPAPEQSRQGLWLRRALHRRRRVSPDDRRAQRSFPDPLAAAADPQAAADRRRQRQ